VETREFLELLLRMWGDTYGAETGFWGYDTQEGGGYRVFHGDPETEEETNIGHFLYDSDANFVTAIHGALPDLIRVTLAAFDEADRADYDRDSRECLIAELELELQQLKGEL
jgi:hypothetical protein